MPYIHANPPAGVTSSAEEIKRALHLDRMRHLATMTRPETSGGARFKTDIASSVYHTPIGQHGGEYAQHAHGPPFQPPYADWAAPANEHRFAAPNQAQAARTCYEPRPLALTPGPAHANFDNRVPTPHDTYRYPAAYRDPVYVPQESGSSKKDRLNDALSAYYVTEVTKLLVEPGQYRPGVGGQSEEIWGKLGREREEYERVGLPVPDRSQTGYWGRMGMASGAIAMPSRHRARTLQYEPYDPYKLLQHHRHHPRPTVVAFVKDILTRMTISPTAVITALWYLKGLGLHQGDGDKGEIIRGYLHEASEEDGVLKRVVVLGLVLAGKWLDDNSFLTKSWNEVTRLPIRLIDTLERVALKDFHYSLHIPLPSWIEHITTAHIGLLTDKAHPHTPAIETLLDQMIGEARDALLNDPLNWVIDNDFQYATSTPNRDWRDHSRSLSMRSQEAPEWAAEDLSIDIEAERNVAALVADDEVVMDDEEDEYDFVEYDGAKPWLPTMSDLRRSHSNSSAVSQDESLSQWRGERYYASNHHANSSVTEIEQLVTQPSMSQYESSYDHDCSQCYSQLAHAEADAPWSSPLIRGDAYEAFEEDGYLEPGISVVRPSAAVEVSVPSTVSSATATMTGFPARDRREVRVAADLEVDHHYGPYEAYDQYDQVPQYEQPQTSHHRPRYLDGDYKAPITNPYNFTYTPPSYHQYPFRE